MSSVNKVILIGHLGKDPETRHTQDGKPICNLSVATSEKWTDKQTGERRERTEWHRVVIFNEHLAEIAQKYLRKGSKAYLEGQLQTRKWTDQSGTERYSTEVVLQRYRGQIVLLGDGAEKKNEEPAYGSHRGDDAPAAASPPNDLDDEIPF